MRLKLERPLVFFDLETTGTDPASDRIVEISAVKVAPGGERDARLRRINPERPIPPEATAVHGIGDDDVRDAPPFRAVARGLLDFLGDADLAGFNVLRFDLPLLERELADCGMDLRTAERHVVDAMAIFHRMEPRDLTAALKFYLGREHAGAHSAEADVLATVDVLAAQLERYPDLPDSVAALHDWQIRKPPGAVDRFGKFVWKDGEAAFTFGKHAGRTLREVAAEAPDYLQWILKADFPSDARALVRDALRGTFPRPEGAVSPRTPGSA